MSAAAEIAVERRGGAVVAHLGGEVDMTNATYVRDELLGSVPNDALALVLELGGCRYLDSAAIEVLFDIVRRLEPAPPGAAPRGPGRARTLVRLIELTELASVAAVDQSVEAALGQ